MHFVLGELNDEVYLRIQVGSCLALTFAIPFHPSA